MSEFCCLKVSFSHKKTTICTNSMTHIEIVKTKVFYQIFWVFDEAYFDHKPGDKFIDFGRLSFYLHF